MVRRIHLCYMCSSMYSKIYCFVWSPDLNLGAFHAIFLVNWTVLSYSFLSKLGRHSRSRPPKRQIERAAARSALQVAPGRCVDQDSSFLSVGSQMLNCKTQLWWSAQLKLPNNWDNLVLGGRFLPVGFAPTRVI